MAQSLLKNSPFQTLADVLNAMKTSPKDVTLAGGSAPGSMDHLVGIIPAYKAGIDLKQLNMFLMTVAVRQLQHY